MGVAGAGGGRAARGLRLLLLLVMALAAVEYLCWSIFKASPIGTYLYTPLYNATQPTLNGSETVEMPFSIVLTKEGSSELISMVPSTWVNNSILHWPRINKNSDLEQLRRDEFSVPSSNWKKIKCKTKLQGIATFAEGIKLEQVYCNFEDTEDEAQSIEKSSSSWPKRLSNDATIPKSISLETQQLTRKVTNNSTAIEFKSNITTTRPLDSSTLVYKITESIKYVPSSTEFVNFTGNLTTPYCEVPSNLGPVPLNKTEIELSSLDDKYPEVASGGWYKPPNCTAKHTVAIIIPYRDREQHLPIFLNHMHPFLMRQQLDYGIFVIEQQGRSNFNRAKLFNAGFMEINRLREGGWQCFVFHDVDLLPLDERNLYTCPRQPRHMSAALDKYNYKLKYEETFGGVSAMTREQFTKVNGFSNKYWGWGGEDDDMCYRFVPPGSYINARDQSVEDLATLIHKLISHPKMYQRYFRWKKYYSYKSGVPYTICNVCLALINRTKYEETSVYHDIKGWWNLQESS